MPTRCLHKSEQCHGTNRPIKPFVKWAGGKGQLLKEIQKFYPDGLGTTYTKYAEPFVGGGAVLCDILSRYRLKEVYISDINQELITTYTVIRDNVLELINLLAEMQSAYASSDKSGRKKYFYDNRERFNEIKTGESTNTVECSALFIFLNKTCFNGLYRVNSQKKFNVPMGAYKNPSICDRENLLALSQTFQDLTAVCSDYREVNDFIDSRTFVYFDPPYRPLNTTSNFTAYTENCFDDSAQKELSEFVNFVTEKGARVIVSNSDPQNINKKDNFFDKLYAAHKINRVEATRMINCNSALRGRIHELLISNF